MCKSSQSVRKIATREFKLLDSIGTAHMEEEIEQKVLYTTSRNQEILKEQTGIESSLEEGDIKQYLEVLKEVKAKENKT